MLAVLLPTEDLENDCLTALVSQILSEMILGSGIGGRACEPWLLWESITNIAQVVQTQLPKSIAQLRVNKSLENTSVEKPQSGISGKVNSSRWFLQKNLWLILQYAFLAFSTIRFVIVTVATSYSAPWRLRSSRLQGPSMAEVVQPPAWTATISRDGQSSPLKQPILSMKVWGCAASLLDLDIRMPWLCATASMLQWFALRGPGALGSTDGIIDKYGSRSHFPSPSCDLSSRAAYSFSHLTWRSPLSVEEGQVFHSLVCAHPYRAPSLQALFWSRIGACKCTLPSCTLRRRSHRTRRCAASFLSRH